MGVRVLVSKSGRVEPPAGSSGAVRLLNTGDRSAEPCGPSSRSTSSDRIAREPGGRSRRPDPKSARNDMADPIASRPDPASAAELPAPYGGGGASSAEPGATSGSSGLSRKVRVHHLRDLKDRGEKWAMLTAYDQYTAAVFEEAGIPVLLVGDSAANNVYGYETTVPITVEEMLPLVRAVARSTRRALVVADLPFGSYHAGPEQALATSVRMMKEGLAHAVKLEGGRPRAASVEAIVSAGIPVMGHLGFTPQSEHTLGGYRVQGRGEDSAQDMVDDALALQGAGAFAVVLEMVPAPVAAMITKELRIPTVGIGAGPHCDAQVLVWQDALGLRTGRMPRFVKQYADLHGTMLRAARDYADDVRRGTFPAPEHSFDA
ncbi:MAG: 3-methyl-2-oxobutanoate hydroxymethyltransferase [Actinomycetota bacterium]|nr:3-methyl-2-oxobutanoate hydroxymethyltransferase [Actinomycetota bacterium]